MLLFVLLTLLAAVFSVGAVGVTCSAGHYIAGGIPGMCGHNAGVSVILAFAVLWPFMLLVGHLVYWKLREQRGPK